MNNYERRTIDTLMRLGDRLYAIGLPRCHQAIASLAAALQRHRNRRLWS